MQQVSVPVELEKHIQEQYNYIVTISLTEILCSDDESEAICDLKFVGHSAISAVQLFINDLSKGIDFSTFILRLCNHNCLVNKNEMADMNRDNKDSTNLLIMILLAMVIVFALVAMLLCLILCYIRYMRKYINYA